MIHASISTHHCFSLVPSYEPPSYNDVVSSPDSVSHQPSAPPISEIEVTDDRPPASPGNSPSSPHSAAGGGNARHRGSGTDETDYGKIIIICLSCLCLNGLCLQRM